MSQKIGLKDDIVQIDEQMNWFERWYLQINQINESTDWFETWYCANKWANELVWKMILCK